ncbi:hypothetical protein BSF41_22740 [Flavobacterium sp. ACN2]|uniref:hypothetical protein n=1 Tax=Flavobacterium sp. ACN2 TaxID=1975676 RepID=UPI000BB34E50|nr:hypothetical protein [Flavobacterium sp. ACN2]PBI88906.1 hypothetical protein BSF41_22740 [Flavobacterium sp. ACN2]
MAKGVKKIRWTGKGRVINNLCIPNKKVVIHPDQEVSFEIESWYDGTTEEEKKRNITWILQEAKTRKEIAEKLIPSITPKLLSIPKNLCGPYEYYLEASLFGKRDLYNDTGLIIRGECPPKILDSKWCKTNNAEDVRKIYFFSYGEKLYLNLKTEGLNGHLNLSIDIFRRVKAGINVSIKRYTSIDVIDGQVNLEIKDSFSWYNLIKDKNEVEEFYIQIFDPVNRTYITDYNNDIAHARFLRVKNKIASMEVSPPTNLSPLKTGEPATNYMSHHFCKYTFIKMNDKMLFDEAKLIEGQKLSRNIYAHLFAGGDEKNKKVTIELGEKIPGKCDNHKAKVFDITNLQKAGIQNPQRVSANSFSFENNFEYKFKDDYRQFFTEYILPIPAVKAAIPLATCSYQHVLNIEMLPDVAWAYHFQYDKPNGGLFKDINIKIQSGLKEELNYIKEYLGIFIKHAFNIPSDYISDAISDIAIYYLDNTADQFGFGIHAYHSFDQQGLKPAVIMDYTAKYKWIAKAVILHYVIISVLVDALILYLTRGRGALSKVGKIVSAVDKYGKKVAIIGKRKGFELITPKITSYRAQYYEKQPDGRIAFVQTEKVSALPLFGLQYEDKHTLGTITTSLTGISTVFDYARKAISIFGQITLLKKIQNKLKGVPSDPNKMPSPINTNDLNKTIDWLEEAIENGAQRIFSELGHELNFTVTIKGEYQANYQIFINHLAEAISIKDQLENYVNNSKGIVGRKKGINAVASCELKTGYHIKTEWIMRYAPNFIQGVIPVIDREANAEGQAEIHGSLFYERKYFFEKPQSYYVDNVIFSGLAGSFSGSVKTKKNGKTPRNNNIFIPETSFVLMEPYVVKGERIYLFEKDTIKEPK